MGSKQKSNFFAVIILTLMLIPIICMPLVSTAQAVEPNLQAKTLTILNEVIGINTDKYNASQSAQKNNAFLNSPDNSTDVQLTSEQSSLRVTCSYVNGTLKLLYVSDSQGELALKQQVTNTVDMAKGLLQRYQTYSGASIYSKFASMLNEVKVNVDTTIYAPNIKLDVSGSDQNRTTYTWTYVDSSGVPVEKKNVVLVYEKGELKGFFNNWPLYTIVESKSKVSAEQATELAIAASMNYSYPVTCENGSEVMVSGFNIDDKSLGNAKLIYINSIYQQFAHGGDVNTMYLAWYVPLGFDKFYPGDVSGLTVILWADTGEVCSMDRVIVDSGIAGASAQQTIDNKTAVVQLNQPEKIGVATQAIGVSLLAGIVFASVCNSKIISTGRRKRVPKIIGVLFCIIIVISMIFLPTVGAVSATGRSRVYSSVGTLYGYNNDSADAAEANAASVLCNYIGNASLDAGYITTNSYANTVNTAVVSDAGSDEQNYLGTLVFHAGHFSSKNTAYQDSSGNPIYCGDLLSQTGLRRHFFVFLWVCVQAESNTGGTSVGWTHRDANPGIYLSSNGFSALDGEGQCYISFSGYSPMLSEDVPNSQGYYYNFAGVASPGPCNWFGIYFYYYALYQGYSVHDSLDLASESFFGCDYSNTVLYTGYQSWWPGGNWQGSSQPYMCNSGYYPNDFRTAGFSI
jgi:hypothetical protein